MCPSVSLLELSPVSNALPPASVYADNVSAFHSRGS